MNRTVRYASLGALLALGAPGGWLLYRLATGQLAGGALGQELWGSWDLYLYMGLGTALAFGSFGGGLGRLGDQLELANRRLEELAVTDGLTHLRNARFFHEHLAAECQRARAEGWPLALVMVDLDYFKRLNDRLGHHWGDRALAHAAGLAARAVRAGDVACRVGGEEFGVLCPRTTMADAFGVAERIRLLLEEQPLAGPHGPERLTASLGVAVLQPGMTPEQLYQTADAALYQAKQSGRNRTCQASEPASRQSV